MADTNINTGALEAGAPVVIVNFGVYIPEQQKAYTKAEIEADPDIINYLIDIESGAVTVVKEETV